MSSFSIQFAHPWLFLLLIPALFLSFFPYFRLSKRYRRTRNRITSLVLHTLVMVLAICLFVGTTFHYSIPNKDNELILLVDVSDTEEESAEQRDEFVETVLDMARFDNYKVGVVTFGYNQVYAVPLTPDVAGIYDKYKLAELPDQTATNLASALTYTKDLFTNPSGGKILLISDGKETDEKALSVIRSVSAQGIKVDTALVGSSYSGSDVRVVEATLPETHMKSGVEYDFSISLQVKTGETPLIGTVTLYDNGVADEATAQTVDLTSGTRDLTFKHSFASALETGDDGFHEIRFEFTATGSDDYIEQNNLYYTYVKLENFNKILVLSGGGSSDEPIKQLLDIDDYKTLGQDGQPISTVVSLDVSAFTEEDYPKTVDQLREYDQVILNNVAYADMPTAEEEGFEEDFEKILYSYVYEYGGGLFTVGGNENGDVDTAHAYNRVDVKNSTYFKQLLPVEIINYTPPMGFTIIIDRSGSMSGSDGDGRTFFNLAKAGAISCLNALTDRDYMSIMTLDSYAATILPLTPRTHEAEILAAIDSIEDTGGGTVYQDALATAGSALAGLSMVEKRHIMIVTDGQPNEDPADYEGIIKDYYNEGKGNSITFSIVGIGVDKPQNAAELDKMTYDELVSTNQTSAYAIMLRIAKLGGGRLYVAPKDGDTSKLIPSMREDLNSKELKEVTPEKFFPTVYDLTSPLVKDLKVNTDNTLNVQLGGYYGVKVKNEADLILTGNYSVPLYAQWKYGKGMVGSFMSDLNGTWSGGFLEGTDAAGNADESGRTFLLNVINNLMPTENIRPNDISISLKENNYTNSMSVYAGLMGGESVSGTIAEVNGEERSISLNQTGGNGDFYVTVALDATNNYSRCNFVVKKGGIYKITLIKNHADGTKSEFVTYKTFSYSEEYDFSAGDEETVKNLMDDLAKNGNGSAIADLEDPSEVFATFVTELSRSFDPRWLFAIIIIIAFLLDIAVRKFKFKWPHEIIRDAKAKKAEGKKEGK